MNIKIYSLILFTFCFLQFVNGQVEGVEGRDSIEINLYNARVVEEANGVKKYMVEIRLRKLTDWKTPDGEYEMNQLSSLELYISSDPSQFVTVAYNDQKNMIAPLLAWKPGAFWDAGKDKHAFTVVDISDVSHVPAFQGPQTIAVACNGPGRYKVICDNKIDYYIVGKLSWTLSSTASGDVGVSFNPANYSQINILTIDYSDEVFLNKKFTGSGIVSLDPDVEVPADPDFIAQETPVCQGTLAASYSVTPVAGVTYDWWISTVVDAAKGDNDINSDLGVISTTDAASGIASVDWKVSSTTAQATYYVCVQAVKGGEVSEIVSTPVVVNPLPTVTLVADPLKGCTGAPLALTATGANGSSYTYEWKVSSTSLTVVPTTIVSGTNEYSVVAKEETTGCLSVADSETVTGTEKPELKWEPELPTSLVVGPDPLDAIAVATPDGTYTWDWTGSSIAPSTGTITDNKYAITLAAGNIFLTVTATKDGCVSEALTYTNTVSEASLDKPTFPESNKNEICLNADGTYTINAVTDADAYKWWVAENSDGTSPVTTLTVSETTTSATFKWDATKTITAKKYYVCVQATKGLDPNKIESDTASYEVTVKSLPSATLSAKLGEAVFASGSSICAGSILTFTAASDVSGATYTWTGRDAGSGGATQSITMTYGSGTEDIYTVTAQNPTTLCENTSDEFKLTVKDTPILGNFYPTLGSSVANGTLYEDLGISVDNSLISSPDGYNYAWDVNGDEFSTPKIDLNIQGTTDIAITVSKEHGTLTCSTTKEHTITAIDGISLTLSDKGAKLCTDGVLPLIATVSGITGNFTYTWYSGATAAGAPVLAVTTTNTENIYAPSVAGDYTVVVTVTSNGTDYRLEETKNIVSTPANAIAVETVASVVASFEEQVELCATPTDNKPANDFSFNWEPSEKLLGNTTQCVTTIEITENTDYVVYMQETSSGCISEGKTTVSLSTDPKDIELIVDPVPALCQGNTFQLNAELIGGTGTPSYEWIQKNGPESALSAANIANPIFTANATGTYEYLVVATVDGQSKTEIVTITVNNIAPIVVLVANPTSGCIGTTVTLTATPTGGASADYTYTWGADAAGGLMNANTHNVAIQNVANTYTVSVTDRNGCKSESATTSVVGIPVPVIEWNDKFPKVEIADGTAIAGLGITTSATITSYDWTITNVPINATNKTGTDATIDFSVSGNAEVKLIASNGGVCPVSKIDTIYTYTDGVDQKITLKLVSDDSKYCMGGVVPLKATVIRGAGPYTYTWYKTNADGELLATVANTTDIEHIYLAQEAGTYFVEVSFAGGESVSETLTVLDGTGSVVAVEVAGSIVASLNEQVSLWAKPAGSHLASAFSFNWEPVGKIDGNDAKQIAKTTPITEETYYQGFMKENRNGCISTGITVVSLSADPADNLELIVDPVPVLCQGNTVQLNAELTGGIGTPSYVWTPIDGTAVGALSNTDIANPTFTANTVGVYRYAVKASVGNPKKEKIETVTITVNNSAPTVVLAATPTSGCIGTTVTLTATPTGGASADYTYTWGADAAGGLMNANTHNVAIQNVTNTYTVSVTDRNGCKSESATKSVVGIPVPVIEWNDKFPRVEIADGTPIAGLGIITSAAITSYDWTITNVPSNVGNTSGSAATIDFTMAGNAEVKLIANDGGVCSPVTKIDTIYTYTDEVDQAITLELVSEGSKFCMGGVVPLKATVIRGTGPYTYKWYKDNISETAVETVTTTNIEHIYLAQEAGTYFVEVSFADGSPVNKTLNVLDGTGSVVAVEVAGSIVASLDDQVSLWAKPEGSHLVSAFSFNWEPEAKIQTGATEPIAETKPIKKATEYQVFMKENSSGCVSTGITAVILSTDPSDDLDLIVDPQVATVCKAEVLYLSAVLISDTDAPVATYLWTAIAGTPVGALDNINIATPTFTATTAGVYKYEVTATVTETGVAKTEIVTITVQDATAEPVTLIAKFNSSPLENKDSLCGGSAVQLSVTPSTGTITWSGAGISGSGVINDITLAADENSTNEYIVTVEGANGCRAKDTIELYGIVPKLGKFNPDLSRTNLNGTVHENLGIEVDGVISPTTGCVYDWKVNTIAALPSASSPTIYLNIQGETEVSVQVDKEYGTLTCSATDTVKFTPIPGMSLILAKLDEGAKLCTGGVLPLKATVSGVTGEFTYKWYTGATATGTSVEVKTLNAENVYAPSTAGDYTVEVTVTAGGGIKYRLVETINVAAPESSPLVAVEVASNMIVASGDPVDLWAIPEDNKDASDFSFNWEPKDKLVTGDATEQFPKTIAIVEETNYVVYMKETNSGCVSTGITNVSLEGPTDDLVLIVNPTSATLCKGNDLQLSAELTGTNAGTPTYKWLIMKEPSANALSATDISNPVFTATVAGEYQYMLTATGTDHSKTEIVTITVSGETIDELPQPANIYCVETPLTMPTVSGLSYHWEITPDVGDKIKTTGDSYEFTEAGVYTVKIVGKKGHCTSDTITILDLDINKVTLAQDLVDGSTYINDATINSVATAGGGVVPYTYNWTAPTEKLSSATHSQANATAESYTFTVNASDDKGCTATSSVTVNKATNTLVLAIDTMHTYCTDGMAMLKVEVSGGHVTTGYTYKWHLLSGGAPAGDPLSITATCLVENPAANTYRVTVSDNSDPAIIASMDITPSSKQNTTLSAAKLDAKDAAIVSGADTKLLVTATPSATASCSWSWSPIEKLAGVTESTKQNAMTAELNQNQEYNVYMIDDKGCISPRDTATVTIVTSGYVLTINANETMCMETTQTLSVTANPALPEGATYEWTSSVGDLFTASTAEASPEIRSTIAGTYTVGVVVTVEGKPYTTFKTIVFGGAKLDLNLDPVDNASVCVGDTVKVTVAAAGAIVDGGYTWYIDGAEQAVNTGDKLLLSDAGTKEIKVSAKGTTSTCVEEAQIKLIINALPVVEIDSVDFAGMENHEFVLGVKSPNAETTYEWKKDDDNFVASNVPGFEKYKDIITADMRYVLKGEKEGCLGTDTIRIYKLPTAPTLDIDTIGTVHDLELTYKPANESDVNDGYQIMHIHWDGYGVGGEEYAKLAEVTSAGTYSLAENSLDTLEFFYARAYRTLKLNGKDTMVYSMASDTVGYYKQDIKMNPISGKRSIQYIPLFFDITKMNLAKAGDLLKLLTRNKVSYLYNFDYGRQRWNQAFLRPPHYTAVSGNFDLKNGMTLRILPVKPTSFLQYGKLPNRLQFEFKNTNTTVRNINICFVPPHRKDLAQAKDFLLEERGISYVYQWDFSQQKWKQAFLRPPSFTVVSGNFKFDLLKVITVMPKSSAGNIIWK